LRCINILVIGGWIAPQFAFTCLPDSAGFIVTRQRFFIVAVVAVLLAAGAAWWTIGRGPLVAAVAAKRGTAVEIVYATGGVEPVRWAKVASLVRGRIADICYCEGRTVKKGDALAQLDDSEVKAQVKELKAREDFLKREMSRVSELITRGAATTQAQERASMDLRQVEGLISEQNEKISIHHCLADGRIGSAA
jgi:multidrug efflux pump subunit AcrA (membrane-fusion protein)